MIQLKWHLQEQLDCSSSRRTDTLLGSLNGVFFTDASTSKPTYANHLNASNTATDIVGFVSDDPYQRFEIQSDGATAAQADVGLNADIVMQQVHHLIMYLK